MTLECEIHGVRGPIGRGKVAARVGRRARRARQPGLRGDGRIASAVIGSANGHHVSITGLGASVPERVLTNDELAKIVDTSDEWIVARTGIHERRVAGPDEALSDISPARCAGAPSSRRALTGADIDLVIVATVTPDMAFPATAALIADELGAATAAAYDLSAGCTGFVYAVAQAYAMLAGGLANRALVVGGDLLSKVVDWHDRATCVLFGDGAGAVVLERVDRGGFLGFELGADGGGGMDLYLTAGGSRSAGDRGDGRRRRALRADERPRGVQVRDARARLVGEAAARPGRPDDRGRRRLRPAPGEHPDHQPRGGEARHPRGEGRRQRRPLRQHVVGIDPARARGRRR